MERIMKIDYYQFVLPSEELRTFADLLELLSQTPNDATRNKDYQGMPIRLQEIRKINALWLGDMVKIRMDGIPPNPTLRSEAIKFCNNSVLSATGLPLWHYFFYFRPRQQRGKIVIFFGQLLLALHRPQ